MTEQQQTQDPVLNNLGISTNVLEPSADRPTVLITVEGKVGSAKTALVNLITKMLKEHDCEALVADEYTRNELKTHAGADDAQELKMYNPKVVIREKLTATFQTKPIR